MAQKKSFPVWELLTAALFSLFMVFGAAFEQWGDYRPLLADPGCCILTGLQFLCWLAAFYVGIRLLFSLWDHPGKLPSPDRIQGLALPVRIGKGYASLLYRHSIAVPFVTLAVKSIPYFIASYPAIFMGDSGYQIGQTLGTVPVSNGHPVIHTALIGLFLKLEGLIGWNPCIFLYALTQALFLLLIMALCIHTLVRMSCRKWVALGVLAFYVLHPRIEAYLFLVSKDCIYSAFFVLFVLLLLRLAVSEQPLSPGDTALLILSVVGMTCFRNEGKLLAVLSLIPALLWRKSTRLRACAAVLAVLITGALIAWVICPAMGAARSVEIREVLSIPFQQTARYTLEYPQEITQQEQQAIDAVLDFDQLAQLYDPNVSDPVKRTYKDNSDALPEYFRAWFSMLRRHPGVCLRATLHNYYQYVYPSATPMNCFSYSRSGLLMLQTNEATGLTAFSQPEATGDFRLLVEKGRETLARSPLYSLLNQTAIYVWMALLCVIYCIRKRSMAGFTVMAPILVQLVFFSFGPTNAYYARYQLGLIICIPVLLCLLPRLIRENAKKNPSFP